MGICLSHFAIQSLYYTPEYSVTIYIQSLYYTPETQQCKSTILQNKIKIKEIKNRIGVLVWHSRSRIWYCHCSSWGHYCGSGSIPDLGTSICCKIKLKKNPFYQTVEQYNLVSDSFFRTCFFRILISLSWEKKF